MKNIIEMRSLKTSAIEWKKNFPNLLKDVPSVDDDSEVIREKKNLNFMEAELKGITNQLNNFYSGPAQEAAMRPIEGDVQKVLAGVAVGELNCVSVDSQKAILVHKEKVLLQAIAEQREKLQNTINRVKIKISDEWEEWVIDEIIKPEIIILRKLETILQKKVVANDGFNRAGLDESYRPSGLPMTSYEKVLLKGGQYCALASIGFYISEILCKTCKINEDDIKI